MFVSEWVTHVKSIVKFGQVISLLYSFFFFIFTLKKLILVHSIKYIRRWNGTIRINMKIPARYNSVIKKNKKKIGYQKCFENRSRPAHWDLPVSSARKSLRLCRALSAGSHEAQVKPDCRSTKKLFRGVTWTGLNRGALWWISPHCCFIIHQLNFFIHVPDFILIFAIMFAFDIKK